MLGRSDTKRRERTHLVNNDFLTIGRERGKKKFHPSSAQANRLEELREPGRLPIVSVYKREPLQEKVAVKK